MIDMDGRVPLSGQLERSSDGRLWVVLYRGTTVVRRERVRSRRRGRRWLIDMVLADADGYPAGLDRRQATVVSTRRIRDRRSWEGSDVVPTWSA